MTERERFIKALKREPLTGRVPTFELVFYLTMEKFGRVHPLHREYSQWNQMSVRERKLHVEDMAELYVRTAETYHHSAIFVHFNPHTIDNILAVLERIREISGDKYFLMMHGDATLAIPDGDSMTDFAYQMYEDPDSLRARQEKDIAGVRAIADTLSGRGLLDGFALCSDYAFNANPFFPKSMFEDLVAPYLAEEIALFRERGFYTIKHTDGNIEPILESIVECGPDAIHSIDPQGGMNLESVRRRFGGRISTCGNVNCGLLQTGTEQEAEAAVRESIRQGLADGGRGFVFCTSNCAYTGMPLERYERMNDIWYQEAIL